MLFQFANDQLTYTPNGLEAHVLCFVRLVGNIQSEVQK
jgi:hypothetical protein